MRLGRNNRRGAALLIITVFLFVLVALVGSVALRETAAMVSSATAGGRALQAGLLARSGLEWSLAERQSGQDLDGDGMIGRIGGAQGKKKRAWQGGFLYVERTVSGKNVELTAWGIYQGTVRKMRRVESK